MGVRRRFFCNCVRLGAAAVAALLAVPVDASPKVVYDSTNFYTSGADGYGFLGITSLDNTAIFGDSLHLAATGKLTSFTWVAFNGSGSTADLTSATETISFYRQSDNSLIGSFNATITDLTRGSSKSYTADLGSANIVLDTPDVLVTQQIPNWPPAAPSYRLGTVIATASNNPAIGSTDPGYYRSQFGSQGAYFTDSNYPNYSSAVYKAVVLPDLTWNTTNGTWNTSTANWTAGSGPNDTFSDGSQATFNNASGGIVTLSGALAPRAVVVSATGGNYAFVSTTGNEITGAATLSKSGAGTLLLYGPNSYSGGTTLNGGALALGHADAIGASGTISFGGGTLRYSGSNTTDYSARFSNAASQQYKIDTYGETVTLASNLTSSGGSFTKLGEGTVTLTGASTYSGATTVSAGTLLVNGSLANSAVTVGSGGTLGGGGTLGSLVTVQPGGVLSPGNSPGALAAAALDLQAGSTTLMQVIGSGSAAGVAGTDYDQVQITTSGGLTYGGTLELEFGNGSSFADGTFFDLFAFSGFPVGHFSAVVSAGTGAYAGMTFSGVGGIWTSTVSSQRLTFSELTGRLTFALAAVPEIDPATGSSALALVAGMLEILQQRRRRAKVAA